jgi:hypothetical protein
MKRIAMGAVALILMASAAGCSSGSPTPPPESSPAATSPAVESPAAPAPVDSSTPGQKNALRAAEQFIKTMPFSASGLVKQLEFGKYSTEDAQWAVDHLTVDWNEQAAKKAKQYLETMPFSRDKLVDQLAYNGFTPEQAEYGVTQAGL